MAQCEAVASADQHMLGERCEVLNAKERISVVMLAASRHRLVIEAGRLDTQTEKGLEACSRFLRTLENTATALDLEAAPRDYRESFSLNYRGLFTEETRSYRVDILEAGTSLDRHPVIWANGEEYELSGDAMECSEKLKEAWSEVLTVLDMWITTTGSPRMPPQFDRAQLVAAMDNLDRAWACFENAYISELMKVQERARGLVAQAVDCERCLSLLEQSYSEDELVELPAYQAEKRALVACIARLNSVANFQRKGRDDLTVGILDAAVELLEHCDDTDIPLAAPGVSLGSARMLAEQVVESFEELRDYLHEVQHHLELLHPHLCQNAGLVARLVRWEESWEIGARYVHNEDVLGALCYLVPQIQRARSVAPALREMCEDCDAELFLILPRIVWLCLLKDPAKAIELIRRLLPHRFEQRAMLGGAGGGPFHRLARSHSNPDLAAAENARVEKGPCMGSELQAVTEKFWRAEMLLSRALSPGAASSTSAWEVLIRRAVSGVVGSEDMEDPYAALAEGGPRQAAVACAEELMHELEAWSMELQRHSAEDWNECINVLVQCLANGDSSRRKSSADNFAV
mmetsp:Transcript_66803/g.168685  ORF Transcript_66803/g.168685 Transcript_66803/m.168685 type:complete len:575 (-) Transcript_66803:142-1866(-)